MILEDYVYGQPVLCRVVIKLSIGRVFILKNTDRKLTLFYTCNKILFLQFKTRKHNQRKAAVVAKPCSCPED